MRLSAKAEYACLAVLELALHSGETSPLRAADIADANGIPQRFLVQILLQLKGAGLVNSTRGSAGGYHLAVPPEQISLWDVIHLIDGPDAQPVVTHHNGRTSSWEALQRVWDEASKAQMQLLRGVRFDRLMREASHAGADMYYI